VYLTKILLMLILLDIKIHLPYLRHYKPWFVNFQHTF
jgi:hypothetical protein